MLLTVTHKCHENCPHCLADATPDSEEHISMENLEHSLALANKVRSQVIQVSGGEFTLHPNWFELCIKVADSDFPLAILQSNGWWHKKPEYVEKIKELMRMGLMLQVRTDKRYYASYDEITSSPVLKNLKNKAGNPKSVLEEGMCLSPLGRARKNYIKFSDRTKAPNCSNVFLLAWQKEHGGAKDLASLIQILQLQGKFCKPKIDPMGNVLAGEGHHCVLLGHVTDSPETIFNNILKTKPCDGCGRVHMLKQYAKILGVDL